MKRYRLREEMNGIDEPPGKVWFWELEAGVINAERCIQCGTCVAVCPSNSIGVNLDTDLPELVKMCTGCSLCWDFCPRGGLRYEALWPPSTMAVAGGRGRTAAQVRSDSSDTYWKITGGPPAEGLGAVVDSYAVRAGSTDRRRAGRRRCHRAADRTAGGGGDRRRPGVQAERRPRRAVEGDRHHRHDGRRRSARPRAASTTRRWRWPSWISRSTRSPPSPGSPSSGTPCEVQGIRAMQARRWPTGAHRVDAVVLTIALMCTKNFDYEALTLRELRDKRGVDLDRVGKMDVHTRPDDRRVPRRRARGRRAGEGFPRRRAQGL